MADANVKPEKKTTAPKKVVATKTATKPKTSATKAPAETKKTATAKSATKPASKKTKATTVDLEQRYRMIEVAAYFIAESDGFSGNPVDYWIAAEAQIKSKD